MYYVLIMYSCMSSHFLVSGETTDNRLETGSGHNSYVRDFLEYIQEQMWDWQNFTRQSSRSFGRNLADVIYVCCDSAHPTY